MRQKLRAACVLHVTCEAACAYRSVTRYGQAPPVLTVTFGRKVMPAARQCHAGRGLSACLCMRWHIVACTEITRARSLLDVSYEYDISKGFVQTDSPLSMRAPYAVVRLWYGGPLGFPGSETYKTLAVNGTLDPFFLEQYTFDQVRLRRHILCWCNHCEQRPVYSPRAAVALRVFRHSGVRGSIALLLSAHSPVAHPHISAHGVAPPRRTALLRRLGALFTGHPQSRRDGGDSAVGRERA